MSALLQIHSWYTLATEKPLQTRQLGPSSYAERHKDIVNGQD
jgi:hypothetical protein